MKRKDNFLMQVVGGENLLIPIGSQVVDMNGIVILNATARLIWQLLAQDRTVNELVAGVVQAFETDGEQARADVLTFLEEIAGLGLLEE